MALEKGYDVVPLERGVQRPMVWRPYLHAIFGSRTLRILSSRNAADLFKLVDVNPVLYSSA
jgi:hypothetical protein